MNSTRGTSILTGALRAFSSATWRRRTRSCSAWTDSASERFVPSSSAWSSAATRSWTSSSWVRSARLRKASRRLAPLDPPPQPHIRQVHTEPSKHHHEGDHQHGRSFTKTGELQHLERTDPEQHCQRQFGGKEEPELSIGRMTRLDEFPP